MNGLSDAQKRSALQLLNSVPEQLRNDADVIEMASGIVKSELAQHAHHGETFSRFVLASWINDRLLHEQINNEFEIEGL